MHDGKKKVIPKSYVKKVTTTATGGAVAGTTNPISAGLSDEDAADLASDLGFAGPTTPGKAPAPKPKPKPKPKLKKGEFFLSTVTGGKLPESGIDHIMCITPKKNFAKDMLSDIPKVDETYVWDADLLEQMWLSYSLNAKMLITGWPGTGKTTAVQQFAAWVQHPVMRFNGKDGIEASSFLGYVWVTQVKGASVMEWKDGMMPQGVAQGYIVLIDEVMKLPAGIQMAMQNLYERGGYLTLDDKPGTQADKVVLPHAMFRMFLTDNVKGTGDNFDKFAATQVQDTSFLDRVDLTYTSEYLPEPAENKMLRAKFPDLADDVIRKFVKFARLVRNAYIQSEIGITLSPRGLQTMCELMSFVPEPKICIRMAFLNKLAEQDEIDAVNQMLKTVY
jgi:cobaltochelatase CobS